MALHDVGWMHRDLSPGNSLLTRDRENDGPSFISDLELAKEERSQTSREEISVRYLVDMLSYLIC
jgi:serine/threonine protein kinase